MTAVGLAVALEATADSRYAFWWSLRLPREMSETASRYRVSNLSSAEARELVAEARRLMGAHPC